MVHAALMQVPVMGGRLKSHKPEAVLHMPGVRKVVVIDPANSRRTAVKDETSFGMKNVTEAQHAVAVIADHFWQAKMALEALPVEWDLGSGTHYRTQDDIYKGMAAIRDTGEGKVVLAKGDACATASGKRVVEGEYLTPYGENAVMEPLGGTALVTADACEMWCATQDSRQAYWVAIDETGLAPEQVKVHNTLVGGNFGRRTQAEDLRMVVAIARASSPACRSRRSGPARKCSARAAIARRFRRGSRPCSTIPPACRKPSRAISALPATGRCSS